MHSERGFHSFGRGFPKPGIAIDFGEEERDGASWWIRHWQILSLASLNGHFCCPNSILTDSLGFCRIIADFKLHQIFSLTHSILCLHHLLDDGFDALWPTQMQPD